MRRLGLFCILFLIAGVLSSPAAHAGTSVSAVITTDTTWSLSGSPYELTGTVGVDRGATLTIEPGVQVVASPTQPGEQIPFQVAGNLVVNGTATNPVRFTCTQASLRCWQGIEFVQGSEGTLNHAVVEFAIAALQFPYDGTHTVTNSTLRFNSNGFRGAPTSTVTDSRVIWNRRGSFQSAGNFTRNLVTGNSEGGLTELYTGPPIHGNSIYGNGSQGIVRDMTVYMHQAQSFDATGNWWGTTDPRQIEENIWDHSDDLSNPTELVFEPLLSAPPNGVPDLPAEERWAAVTLTAPQKVRAGSDVTVSASVQQMGPAGCAVGFEDGQILIKSRAADSPEADATIIGISRFGEQVRFNAPQENSVLWAELDHSVQFCDAVSATSLVQVAPVVTLQGPDRARHGGTVKLSGKTTPAQSGSPIKIQRKVGTRWSTVKTTTIASAGDYRTSLKAPAKGRRLNLRALFPGDSDHAKSVSRAISVALR